MSHWLLLRTLRAALTVCAASVAVFVLARLAPGDPARMLLGEQASADEVAEVRAHMGLDRPLSAQFVGWVAHLRDGSLGRSYRRPETTVGAMLLEALGPTVELAIAAALLGWLLGLPLGILAALHRGRRMDALASSIATLGLALPNIVLGPLLILLFGVLLRIAPLPGDAPQGLAALALPALTLGTAMAALTARHTRTALAHGQRAPFFRAARARGIPPLRLWIRYGLRPASLPLVTVAAGQLGALLSGTVVTERIFERPGLGTLLIEAFQDRDLPVLQGGALLVALLYVVVHLGLDLLYGLLDPRVRA